jgi:probable F420-dependent oxidoreductase
MKFDATLAYSSLRDVPAIAASAEALGFAGVWTTETARNPFLPLALVANSTERLSLGTSIAVAFPRSPMVTAQIAWDVAEQSGGRFILGLGTQIKPHIVRRFSSVWDSPGPRLRDYILALRAIWRTFQHNAPLRYDGEFYQFTLMTPFFSPGPIKTPDVPIYIAGVNAYLCKLAGELCQGFHVHPFHTPRYLREHILPNIEAGAASANRSRAEVATTCAIFVVTGANDEEIANNSFAVKSQIAFYASTPSYVPVLEAHGWEAIHEQLNALSRKGQWAEMAALITDEMLHEFAVVATRDQLARRVRERYEGLLDRVGYYFPFDPKADHDLDLWRDAIAHLSD